LVGALSGKTFTLQATPEEAARLSEALAAYAYAAFPPGGSECAQVSRETLLESARQIAQRGATATGAQLRRRQRKVFRSALQWYFSDAGPGDPTQCAAMLAKFP
jgi:hypothetical protein